MAPEYGNIENVKNNLHETNRQLTMMVSVRSTIKKVKYKLPSSLMDAD